MSTIRKFEYEAASDSTPTVEIDANICLNLVNDEMLLELRTTGPVGEEFDPDQMQTFRFSKDAVQELIDIAKGM